MKEKKCYSSMLSRNFQGPLVKGINLDSLKESELAVRGAGHFINLSGVCFRLPHLWFLHFTFVFMPVKATLGLYENVFPEAVGKKGQLVQNKTHSFGFC